MGKCNHEQRRDAHGDAGPDWRYLDVPGVEGTSHDRQDADIVAERPEQVHVDEEVAFLHQLEKSHNLVEILRQNDDVSSIEIQLGFGIDADSYGCLLQTGDIVEACVIAQSYHLQSS